MTVAGQARELPVHQGVGDFPHRHGRQHGDADGDHGGQQPVADLAAIEPDHGIDAPDLEQYDKANRCDDAGHDLAQQRQITVGADLETREALHQLRVDAEYAVDRAEHDDGRHAGGHRDGDGACEILQQQGIAVADVERPDGPHREHEGDGEVMPESGQPIAHGCDHAAGTVRRTDRTGDLPAALQDDDDHEQVNRQHHQAQ